MGSVKFFKHLILTVVVLILVTAAAIIVILVDENKQLQEQTAAPTSATLNSPTVTEQTSRTTPPTTPAPPPAEWPPVPEGDYAHLFPTLYARLPIDETKYVDGARKVYLTFDDGPNSCTPQVLEHLRNHDVKATFFVVPREGTAETLRQIAEEGHAIAVHCYDHTYRNIYASVEAYLEDFEKARNMIFVQTGIWSDIFRFPGGSKNDFNRDVRMAIFEEMERRGFVYFDWDIDSGDTQRRSYDYMMSHIPSRVTTNMNAGQRSIILFHDAGNQTTSVVGDLIARLKRDHEDIEFAVIDRTVRPMQWPRN